MEETETTTNETTLITVESQIRIGSIVNYVLGDGRSAGQIRPAIVVRVWSQECVNLQIFTDGDNDYPNQTDGLKWATSVVYSEDKTQPYSWHYWSPEA